MRSNITLLLACFQLSMLGAPGAFAAAPDQTGKLEARYAAMLQGLRAELRRELPAVSAARLAAVRGAGARLKQAQAEAQAAQEPLTKLASAAGLVAHAKGKWLGGAQKGIAAAEAALKKAKTEAERAAARKQLAHWQADHAAGLKALAERQAAFDSLKANESQHRAAQRTAQAALATAETAERQAADALLAEVAPFLSSARRDGPLVRAAVLAQATPKGLAEFAGQGPEHEALVERLLDDGELMMQMLEADGARGGRYGQAMRIYTGIRQASPDSASGILQRLAVGIAVQHAVPVPQRNAVGAKQAPATVDPVKRYLHYEQAFRAGELDPAFPKMTAWECRLIVDAEAPDHVLAWGREMLRNYRPDHVLNPDYGWRYSGAVRTDVAYRNSHLLHDDDALEFFQNVCKEGGVCGRRAFFGRYIVQAFGLPSVARPQKGHASLGRWTPDGWVINLGAGWGAGKGADGRTDLEFVLETQVRKHPAEHLKALRAQWLGDALGEEKRLSHKPGSGGFWNQLAFSLKTAIVSQAKAQPLAARGAELGEKNESAETRAAAVAKATVGPADKRVSVAADGTIAIPAGACVGGVSHVKCFEGGLQLVCGAGAFRCEVEVPKAGNYALVAKVVTVHEGRSLQVSAGGRGGPVNLAFPYTCGKWGNTAPVTVALARGKNTLNFSKPTGNVAIKEFTLTPAP